MGQSAAHKKNKLLKAQNFKTFKMFAVTPRIHLFDTSCYFVIYQQFRHYHCHTLTSSQKYT